MPKIPRIRLDAPARLQAYFVGHSLLAVVALALFMMRMGMFTQQQDRPPFTPSAIDRSYTLHQSKEGTTAKILFSGVGKVERVCARWLILGSTAQGLPDKCWTPKSQFGEDAFWPDLEWQDSGMWLEVELRVRLNDGSTVWQKIWPQPLEDSRYEGLSHPTTLADARLTTYAQGCGVVEPTRWVKTRFP